MPTGVANELKGCVFYSTEELYDALASHGSKRAIARGVLRVSSNALDSVSALPGAGRLKKFRATVDALEAIFNWDPLKKSALAAKKSFESIWGVEGQSELPPVASSLIVEAIPERAWRKYGAAKVAQVWGVTAVKLKDYKEHDHSTKQYDPSIVLGELNESGRREVTSYFVNTYGSSLTFEKVRIGGGLMVSTSVKMRQNSTDAYIPPEGQQGDIEELKRELALFRSAGVTRNVMLLGRPGVGKNVLATHIATDLGGICLVLKGEQAQLQAAEELAQVLNKITLVFDDVDRDAYSIKGFVGPEGSLPAGSCVIATANTVRTLDPAMMRPGRFDRVLVVETASKSWLRKIADSYAQPFGVILTDEEHEALSGLTPAEAKDVVLIMCIVGRRLMKQEVERVIAQREFVDLNLIHKDSPPPTTLPEGTF